VEAAQLGLDLGLEIAERLGEARDEGLLPVRADGLEDGRDERLVGLGFRVRV
jgi:hypothetical protein